MRPEEQQPVTLRPVVPLRQSFASLVEILRHHGGLLWGGRTLRHDLMREQPVLVGDDPDDGCEDVSDVHLSALREQIERRFSDAKTDRPLRFGKEDIIQAVDLVARERQFHPVADYLRALEWDGVTRLEAVAQDVLLNCDWLAGQLVRKWFLSAVARALRPGCKVDTALILVGTQGAGKSTFFRTLMPVESWFSDSEVSIGGRDAYQALQTVWILEWSELESMRKADEGAVKAFLSSQVDSYRPPYGKMFVHRKRRSVVVGTTNKETFLRDDTGDRRFWVVRTGVTKAERSRMEALVRGTRDQLWAEAVHLFDAGVSWWLDEVDEEQREVSNANHRERDVWADLIEPWLESPEAVSRPITTGLVLERAIGKPPGQWTRADEMRVAAVLKAAGFEQVRERAGRGRARTRRWERTTDS